MPKGPKPLKIILLVAAALALAGIAAYVSDVRVDLRKERVICDGPANAPTNCRPSKP